MQAITRQNDTGVPQPPTTKGTNDKGKGVPKQRDNECENCAKQKTPELKN
jgi:hypothetical protein